MHRSLLLICSTGSVLGCASRPAIPASTPRELPACTPALLASTPPYDTSRISELVGVYGWMSVDTLSTREAPFQGARWRDYFKLWLTDSALRRQHANAPREFFPLGVISGGIIGFDSSGFSRDNPQIQVPDYEQRYLMIRYFAGSGNDLPMDELPISVLGVWGFGGYYENGWPATKDRNGKLVPSFVGYYCAYRMVR